MRATYTGTRAHTARPWMGTNAIHRVAPVLARCAGFDAPVVDVDGLAYRESLQVVRIEGGIANNVVPDVCHVVVNRRIAPSRSIDVAISELYELLGDADTLEVVSASPAAPPNLTNPLVAELAGGGPLGVRPSSVGPTSPASPSHGIPACNFGPGDPSSRTRPASSSSATSSVRCAEVLRAFVGVRGGAAT